MASLRPAIRRYLSPDIRVAGYFRILATPGLAEAYIWSRGPLRGSLVTSHTKLVIDGFPRSANTLARVLFDQLNPSEPQVSSHLHTPRSITSASRLQVPSILLLRDPDDCVTSFIQLIPGLSLDVGYQLYSSYYAKIQRAQPRYVLGHFPLVTNNFSIVLKRCNEKFGTAFCTSRPDVAASSPETLARVDRRLDLFDQVPGNDYNSTVARPVVERAMRAREILDAPMSVATHKARASAQKVYDDILKVHELEN